MEDSKLIDLTKNILDKNSKIGILEAQNSLLKLKLRLTLREIDLKTNVIPSKYDKEKYKSPNLMNKRCQTDFPASPPSSLSSPKTSATSHEQQKQDQHRTFKENKKYEGKQEKEPLKQEQQHQTSIESLQEQRAQEQEQSKIIIKELSTTLSNLKWGFRKREESLKNQLENHRSALYDLYSSHEKLKLQYRNLCNILCQQLDEMEDYVHSRKKQSKLLSTREKEIFILWENLKKSETEKKSENNQGSLPSGIIRKEMSIDTDDLINASENISGEDVKEEEEEKQNGEEIILMSDNDDEEDDLQFRQIKRLKSGEETATAVDNIEKTRLTRSLSPDLSTSVPVSSSNYNITSSPLKRKHHETAVNSASSNASSVSSSTSSSAAVFRKAQQQQQLLERAQEWQQSPEEQQEREESEGRYSVAIDILVPSSSSSLKAYPTDDEEGENQNIENEYDNHAEEEQDEEGQLLNEEEREEQEARKLDHKQESESSRDDEKGQYTAEAIENERAESEEPEDDEEEESVNLEDLQHSPNSYLNRRSHRKEAAEETRDRRNEDQQHEEEANKEDHQNLENYSEADSLDSLYGLKAVLSPDPETKAFLNQTLVQNLFGNQSQIFNDEEEEDGRDDRDNQNSSFEISKSDYSHSHSHSRSQNRSSLSTGRRGETVNSSAGTKTEPQRNVIPVHSHSQQKKKPSLLVRETVDFGVQMNENDLTVYTVTKSQGIQVNHHELIKVKDQNTMTTNSAIAAATNVSVPSSSPVEQHPLQQGQSNFMKRFQDNFTEVDLPLLLSPKSKTLRAWTEDDENYVNEMETVQFQLGEKLVDLDFQREKELNNFQKTIKQTILSSIHSKPLLLFDPKDGGSENDKEKEISQNDKASSLSSSLPLTTAEKELFQKQLFVLQEKIHSLEKEKIVAQNELELFKSSHLTDLDVNNVKLKQLEIKNRELLTLINSIYSSKQTSEIAIQTEKRRKMRKNASQNLEEQQDDEEVESDEDNEEDNEDELSRLLFQQPHSSSSLKKLANLSRIGTMQLSEAARTKQKKTDQMKEEEANNENDDPNNNASAIFNYSASSFIITQETNLLEGAIGKANESTILLDNSNDVSLLLPSSQQQQQSSTINSFSLEEKEEIIADSSPRSSFPSSLRIIEKSEEGKKESKKSEATFDDESYQKWLQAHEKRIKNEKYNTANNSINNSNNGLTINTSSAYREQMYEHFHSTNSPHTKSNRFYLFGEGSDDEEESNQNIFHDRNTKTPDDYDDLSLTSIKDKERRGSNNDHDDNGLQKEFIEYEQSLDKELSQVLSKEQPFPQSRQQEKALGIAFWKKSQSNDDQEEERERQMLLEEFEKSISPKRSHHKEDPEEERRVNESVKTLRSLAKTVGENSAFARAKKLQQQKPQWPDNNENEKEVDESKSPQRSPYEVKETSILSSSRRKRQQQQNGENNNNTSQELSLESFEIMRIEWENSQLLQKQRELQSDNQKLTRELELYRTKIFTIIHQENEHATHHHHTMINDLPDINITFHQGSRLLGGLGGGYQLGGSNSSSALGGGSGGIGSGGGSASAAIAAATSSFQYLSQTTTASQTLYIIHQLVTNNNELIDRLQYTEMEKQRLKTNYQEKENEIYYLTKELEKRETQNVRMKGLINQASNTISVTEQDYEILQKQVEILTKKLQLLMIENQKLSSYYHTSNGSFAGLITNNNNDQNGNEITTIALKNISNLNHTNFITSPTRYSFVK